MSEWRPIETAPTDGTEFLAYDAKAGKMDVAYAASIKMDGGDFFRVYAVQSDGEYGPSDDEFGYASNSITHWMPLPKPPVSTHNPEKEE